MSAEDRLRDILRTEATTIAPDGDGLARIRERVARRRRWRVLLLPGAGLVTVAAVAALVLVAPDSSHRPQTLQQATPSETPSEAPSGNPTETPTASPLPDGTPPADDGGYPLSMPAIWPFTSESQLPSWQTAYPYAQDGLQVGKHFVEDYLGLTGVTVAQPCVSCGVITMSVGGREVGQIELARLGVGFASGHGAQVYTVVDVTSTDLTVTSPKAGAQITSPTDVTGRITGVDENVALRLLTQSGDELATAGAPAGSAVPWTGTLTWSRTDWSHGAVVGVTRSPKDGSINRVVAVPVRRG